MAITVGNTNNANSTTNATVYSLTLDNNKEYAIGFAIGMATAETAMTATATYNSVAMAELISVTGTTTSRRYSVYIFGLAGATTGSRQHQHTFNVGYDELSHNVTYFIGWQTTINGKNYQQTIGIK